jgi:hypothetical protein
MLWQQLQHRSLLALNCSRVLSSQLVGPYHEEIKSPSLHLFMSWYIVKSTAGTCSPTCAVKDWELAECRWCLGSFNDGVLQQPQHMKQMGGVAPSQNMSCPLNLLGGRLMLRMHLQPPTGKLWRPGLGQEHAVTHAMAALLEVMAKIAVWGPPCWAKTS